MASQLWNRLRSLAPKAKQVVTCLIRIASQATAAAYPEIGLLVNVIGAASEQAVEETLGALQPGDKARVEESLARLIESHQTLIGYLEPLADQARTVEQLSNLVRESLDRTPAWKKQYERFTADLADVAATLRRVEAKVDVLSVQIAVGLETIHRRFDELGRKPKSPYWLSIHDEEDVIWLSRLRRKSDLAGGLPAGAAVGGIRGPASRGRPPRRGQCRLRRRRGPRPRTGRTCSPPVSESAGGPGTRRGRRGAGGAARGGPTRPGRRRLPRPPVRAGPHPGRGRRRDRHPLQEPLRGRRRGGGQASARRGTGTQAGRAVPRGPGAASPGRGPPRPGAVPALLRLRRPGRPARPLPGDGLLPRRQPAQVSRRPRPGPDVARVPVRGRAGRPLSASRPRARRTAPRRQAGQRAGAASGHGLAGTADRLWSGGQV